MDKPLDELSARIFDRAKAGPFTFGQLCLEMDCDQHHPMWRKIDGSIQKLRRRGLIAFTREGGKVIWRAKT